MNLRFIPIGFALMVTMQACKSEKQDVDHATASTTYHIPEDFKSRIQIEEVKTEPITESIHLMGSVETDPDNVIDYVSLTNGVVANVHFSLGDAVQKGQVLAELRSTALSALQAQASSMDAEIESAVRNLKTIASLHDDKLASDKDLAEAKSKLEVLRSAKARVSADLNLYNARSGKGVFQIKAPISGIITRKSINPGMQISDGSGVLFTVASLRDVWVMANVYATNLQTIAAGMGVKISSLSYPGQFFWGKISAMSPTMDEEEKVLKARIELPNPDFKLKPGMMVDVIAEKKREKKALAIPIDAIVFADNENYVLVCHDDRQVEARKVVIAAQNDHQYYIESGLKEGERIITKNQLLVFEQIKNF